MMTTIDHAARRMFSLNAVVVILALVSAIALATAAYGVWLSHSIQVELCDTINAGRRPDAGLSTREEDPNAINVRAELRALWEQLGDQERSASIPNASLIDCRTGKPLDTKE